MCAVVFISTPERIADAVACWAVTRLDMPAFAASREPLDSHALGGRTSCHRDINAADALVDCSRFRQPCPPCHDVVYVGRCVNNIGAAWL